MITIYVGNLRFQTTEEEVSALFSTFGEVHTVKLIKDRETGRPRGFGFVEMEDEVGQQAVEALNGKEFGGRTLKVNEAKEREERPAFNGNKRFNNNRYDH